MQVRAAAITSQSLSTPSNEYEEEKENAQAYTVFVSNLSKKAGEKDLRNLFCKYSVRKVRIPHFHETGESRGFAFVDFTREEEAMLAMREYSGRELFGRQIYIEKAYREDDILLQERYRKRRDLKAARVIERGRKCVSWDPDEDSMPVYYENKKTRNDQPYPTRSSQRTIIEPYQRIQPHQPYMYPPVYEHPFMYQNNHPSPYPYSMQPQYSPSPSPSIHPYHPQQQPTQNQMFYFPPQPYQ